MTRIARLLLFVGFGVAGVAWLVGALVFAAEVDAATALAESPEDSLTLRVRVWQHVDDSDRIYISARTPVEVCNSNRALRIRLNDGLSKNGDFRYAQATVCELELRVWQHVRAPARIELSASAVGGHWGLLGQIPVPLDDGHSSTGSYRYGDVKIVVATSTPDDLPAVQVSPGGDEVPRRAPLTINFLDPPPGSDGARIVSIDPPVDGAFVWVDDLTLRFQPALPGWQRGAQYRIVIDADAAGLDADHAHTFAIAGGLEVSYVIPGDGDTEVPANAQVLVQFNRSVAPLTVLQEAPTSPVLMFEPALPGQGEWLNTSLYRFTPTELEPSTTYTVRVPAGLTAITDGVLSSDVRWSFTTIQPAVNEISPQDDAERVAPDASVVVSFNQPMDRASVEAGLVLRTAAGGLALAGSFEWSDDLTTVTMMPASPLELQTQYEVVAPTGLRSARGGATLATRTSRFTTEPPPYLIRTYPADGEMDGDRSGFRLVYSTPMDLDSFEGRVTVSGFEPADVEFASHQRWGDTDVSFSLDLDYATTYTVRIAAGVRDLEGRALPAHEFSFTTRERSGWPYLVLASPSSFSTFSAGRDQILHFHATRIGEVRFELFRLSDSEAETLLRRGFIDYSWYETTTFWPQSEPIREWSESIEAALQDEARLYSTVLGGDTPLPTGHYFLAATPEMTWSEESLGYQTKRVFSVVDTAIVLKQASGELVAWALDYDTGQPLDDHALRAALMERNPQSPYQHATTDREGVARFAVSAEAGHWQAPYGLYLVRIDTEQRNGVAASWWEFGSHVSSHGVPAGSSHPGHRGHLFTERPIYRPGETVHYRGVIRTDDDAFYGIPGADMSFTLTVRDPRNQVLFSMAPELNELGSFSVDAMLPDNAHTGTYRVRLTDAGGRDVADTAFAVEEFRVPEFKVELSSADSDYVAGDSIVAEARASFFFGGAVHDAAVEWSVYAWPTVIRVDGYEDYTFWDRGDANWWRSLVGDRWASGETRTDANGVGRFDVAGKLPDEAWAMQYTISATVTDASGQAIADGSTLTVHPATWYVGIKPESYISVAGAASTIRLVTIDWRRRIGPDRPVTVRVFKREWIRVKQRFYYAGAYYLSEPRDTEVDVQEVTTNAQGEASVEFTPPSAGSYRVVAESTDEQGRVARSGRFLWVRGEGYASWPVRANDVIKLIADRERYEVGDVAEVFVPATFAGATALVTIERGRVLSTEVRHFATNSELLQIPIEDWFIPNVYVGVTLYRPPTDDDPYPRYNVGYAKLSVSTAPRRLGVSVRPDREQAKPGEVVHYEVQVTDSDGRGVEAEVSVAVVDQAVLSLLDEIGPDGIGAFWSERPLAVRTSSSLSASIDHLNRSFRDSAIGDEGSGRYDAGESAPLEERHFPATGGGEAEAEYTAEIPWERSDDARLRSDFRHTALWIGQLQTNEQGRASFELTLPDNATTWRARARAVNGATQIGEGEAELLVTQPLLLRPALPRFLRVGDQVTLRALVQNGATQAQNVTVSIEAEGVVLEEDADRSATIEPGDAIVFGWPARATEEGTATIRLRAAAGDDADAVELSIPVHLDVTPETTATGGVVEDAAIVEAFYVPYYVPAGQGSLEVSLQASLVGALDDEFDHFLPAWRGESNVRVASRIVAAVAVHRGGASGLTVEQQLQLEHDVEALLREQRYGGWAWCRDCRSNDPMVTAWALIVLADARAAGVDVPEERSAQAAQSITDYLNRGSYPSGRPDPNRRAFLRYAVIVGATPEAAETQIASVRSIVDEHRANLTSWGRAYLVLGLLAGGLDADDETVRLLLNDLAATTIASANGNHWQDERLPGCMHNGSVRATALVLQALTAAAPKHPLIEETVRWLVHARAVDRWKTSVERAQGMASFGAYAQLTGERRGSYDYRVLLNSAPLLDGHFNVSSGDDRDGVLLPLDDLARGEVGFLQFERDRTGEGRMYYTLNLRYSTPAAEIAALNRGFGVSHRYSLLDEPDREISSVAVGDVVRVEITVVAPADRLFVRVDDYLPAGLEPIVPRLNVVSPWLREQLQDERAREVAPAYRGGHSYYAPWYAWYYSPWDQVDTRDDHVSLFAERLREGVHRYTYYARATAPGDFFVAPAHAEESYFPEVFGRSDGSRFTVRADD